MAHRFLPNDTIEIERYLLKEIGVRSVEDLFSDIPRNIRLNRKLDLPDSLSELEIIRRVKRILKKNITFQDGNSFLGGGVWHHYIPAIIDAIANRSEFLTSYTPYQPEINQGLLQALFEYQSMICELVDMDIANCSVYDWASALGEAVRMAVRITHRSKVHVPYFIRPSRYATLKTYAEPAGIKVERINQHYESGQIDMEMLEGALSSETAAVYIENPSYLGFLMENLEELSEMVHKVDGLLIVGVNPVSLGLVKPPGEYNADIVIGEGQPLGNHVNFGGPLLGIFASRRDSRFIRQLPGKIVGLTTTTNGNERGYTLALQTREQHIRRERATSNICSNEALLAIRSAIYLSLMGSQGLQQLGDQLYKISIYAQKTLSGIEGVSVPLFNAVHFNEFTLKIQSSTINSNKLNKFLQKSNIIGGKSLNDEFPELGDTMLFSINDFHRSRDIDNLSENMRQCLEV